MEMEGDFKEGRTEANRDQKHLIYQSYQLPFIDFVTQYKPHFYQWTCEDHQP